MQIKWRKYEQILVTLLVVLTICSTAVFDKDRGPVVLLCQIGVTFQLYLLYLWLNLLIIPAVVDARRHKAGIYLLAFLQWLLVSYLFALGINIASYHAHPALYNYGGFRLFALMGYNDHPLTNVFAGFDRSLILTAFYTAYAGLREYFTFKAEQSAKEKPYRVLVLNQVFLLVSIYVLVSATLLAFHVLDKGDRDVIYFSIITPVVLVYLGNTYWLFPSQEKKPISLLFITRLLLSTFLYTVPVNWLFIHYGPARDYWFVWWGFQVLITTPVTWLLYQSRRDNLLQLKNTQKALANSKADLQFLRSQINPHFLFNALNTLYGTALLEQSPKTAEGIQKLGDMMRFMLHDNHLDFIPMSQEVAYLKNYISLFKLRIQTSDNIRITEQIEECNSGQLIGPMLLIPFVENAFKHGISQTEKSWIDIRLNYDEKEIRLEVRNSLHPDKAEDLEKGKSGIGLQNVSERLRLFYSDRHKMHCEAKNGEFVAVLLLKNK